MDLLQSDQESYPNQTAKNFLMHPRIFGNAWKMEEKREAKTRKSKNLKIWIKIYTDNLIFKPLLE